VKTGDSRVLGIARGLKAIITGLSIVHRVSVNEPVFREVLLVISTQASSVTEKCKVP